jgi:GxxExxY protein
MDANRRELLLQKEVYAVVGCAIEVLIVRGHGLHEKIYENCLCVEFSLRGIPFTQQERHQVLYKGELVGEYVPDLVVQQKLIVDTKTIDRITDHERGQMLNYLRITTRWDHPEFQTRPPRVGASRVKRRTEVGSE